MTRILIIMASVGVGSSVSRQVFASLEDHLSLPVGDRVREFRHAGAEGRTFLIRKAADSKAPLKLRWRAVTTMGKLDPEGFRGPLDAALTSPEWFMRNAALIALKHGDRERALTWSTRLLRDPALLVRTQAVRNLIDLDAREAEPILWQQLYDKRNFRKGESLWIRRHLAEAVARFAMAGRARNFERLLRDSDTRLHKWAILGLENVTGLRMSDRKEPVEIRRQKWLARLGEQEI